MTERMLVYIRLYLSAGRSKKGFVMMCAVVSRYVGYGSAGLHACGDILRRITDALSGRPAVAPVAILIPIRNDPRRE